MSFRCLFFLVFNKHYARRCICYLGLTIVCEVFVERRHATFLSSSVLANGKPWVVCSSTSLLTFIYHSGGPGEERRQPRTTLSDVWEPSQCFEEEEPGQLVLSDGRSGLYMCLSSAWDRGAWSHFHIYHALENQTIMLIVKCITVIDLSIICYSLKCGNFSLEWGQITPLLLPPQRF